MTNQIPEWARAMTAQEYTNHLLSTLEPPGPGRWQSHSPEGAGYMELPAVLALGPERAERIVPGREKATGKPANPGWAWHKLQDNAKPDPGDIDCDDDGDTHKPPPKVPKEPADVSALDEARLAVLRDYYCRNHKRPIFSPLADMNGTLLQQ
jgi:hypothetical protein